MSTRLKLCADFQRISIPCGFDRWRQLKEDLILNGCQNPIVVWNNTIIDGHKRYEICRSEGIGFSVSSMSFSGIEEAVCWVCRQRITQVPKETVAHRYLVGMLYLSEKKLHQPGKRLPEDDPSVKPEPGRGRVSLIIASEMQNSPATIEWYGQFARAMNKIAERSPQMFEDILSGERKISMAKLIADASRYKEEEDVLTADAKAYSLLERRRQREREREMEGGQPLAVGIKNMPVFDPDMELRGLTFTIPTWIMSIERAEQKTDMALATCRAKEQLAKALRELENQITHTLEAIQ